MRTTISDAKLMRQVNILANAAEDLRMASIREDTGTTLRLKLLRVKSAVVRYEEELERLIIRANPVKSLVSSEVEETILGK